MAIGGINAFEGQRDRGAKAQSGKTFYPISFFRLLFFSLCLCASATLCLHRHERGNLKSSYEEEGSAPSKGGDKQKALQDARNRIRTVPVQKSTDKISCFNRLSHRNHNDQERRIP
jgi:hypothetical protein